MRIGILTFHHVENYGALWQATSLLQHLNQSGHTAEVIDYRPRAAIRLYRRALFHNRHAPANFLKWLKFRADRNKNLPASLQTYSDNASLHTMSSSYDAVIAGSDEIWGIRGCRGFDPSYFLDFVSDQTPKIAYAACASYHASLDPHTAEIRRLLARFQSISVRDETTRQMVMDLIGRDPASVVDPTLLAGQRQTPARGDYLAIYGKLPDPVRAWLAGQSRKHSLKLISVGFFNRIEGKNFVSAGLGEWLDCLGGARVVVTATFHGMLAAIVHRVPFWIIPRADPSLKVRDFLHEFGLESRYLDPRQLPDIWNPDEPLDFCRLWEQLDGKIASSKVFLQQALQTR